MATVPTAPQIVVRPKCTNQTLEFYWRPPTSDGGDAITGYTLTDGTLLYTITGNPGYYKATGLTNGQSYSFTLAAVNGVGSGPTAAFRSVEPGNKPQPPASVSYTDQGSGNVLVNWTNPADIGGTSRLLGMLVRSFRLDLNNNVNLSSFSTFQTVWGGAANSSYSYPFRSLATSNNWLFQVQLQNDPGRTVRTVGFTSTFIAALPDFSPSTFGSLQLWLDGNDPTTITQSSARVSSWADKSGRANNATMATASNQPSYSSITKSVSFTAQNNYLITPYTANISQESAFMVLFERSKNAAGNVYFGATIGGREFVNNSNVGIYISKSGSAPVGTAGPLLSTQSTTLMNYSYTTVSTNLFFNGSNTNSIASGFSSWTAGTVTQIGASLQPLYTQNAFSGHFHEIILYSTVLGSLQRQTIEGYLAWKWGLSTLLPSWHPFYTRRPLPTDSNLDFSPSSLGGTQVWLDAADTTTIVRSGTTSTIVTWNDKSGRSNNATAVNNPVYLPTDLSVVFNGSSQYFTLPNGALPFSNSSYSYYFIAQFSNTNAGGVIGGGDATNNSSYNIRPDNGQIRNYWYNNDILTQNSFTINTRAAITSYYSTLSTRFLSLNYQSTVSDTPTARTQTNVNNTIGRTVANEFLSGRIYEVLAYSTMHSALDRQRVEGYLAWKWGNQSFLPPTHLYALRAPTRLDTFAAFSPSSITSLQLWLDASVTTSLTVSSVSTVTQWRDLSPLGNHTDTVGGTPIVASNYLASKNAIFFNGSSYFTGPLTNYQSTLTAFIVTALTPGGDQFARIFSLSVPTSNDYDNNLRVAAFYYANTSNFASMRNNGGPATFQISNASTFLGSVNYSGISSFLNYNGGTPTTATTSGLFSTTRYGVAKDPGPLTNLLRGHICEILYYQSSLSLGDRQRVEGYLAWKWGLQSNLPTTHPFFQASTISLGPITSTIT